MGFLVSDRGVTGTRVGKTSGNRIYKEDKSETVGRRQEGGRWASSGQVSCPAGLANRRVTISFPLYRQRASRTMDGPY